MPKINHKDWEDIQKHAYVKGRIVSVNASDDTCSISGGDFADKENVPLFYHCSENAVERSNGALEGAAGAFAKDDMVIVLCRIEDSVYVPRCVIGFVDGIKPCAYIKVLINGKKPKGSPTILLTSQSGKRSYSTDANGVTQNVIKPVREDTTVSLYYRAGEYWYFSYYTAAANSQDTDEIGKFPEQIGTGIAYGGHYADGLNHMSVNSGCLNLQGDLANNYSYYKRVVWNSLGGLLNDVKVTSFYTSSGKLVYGYVVDFLCYMMKIRYKHLTKLDDINPNCITTYNIPEPDGWHCIPYNHDFSPASPPPNPMECPIHHTQNVSRIPSMTFFRYIIEAPLYFPHADMQLGMDNVFITVGNDVYLKEFYGYKICSSYTISDPKQRMITTDKSGSNSVQTPFQLEDSWYVSVSLWFGIGGDLNYRWLDYGGADDYKYKHSGELPLNPNPNHNNQHYEIRFGYKVCGGLNNFVTTIKTKYKYYSCLTPDGGVEVNIEGIEPDLAE